MEGIRSETTALGPLAWVASKTDDVREKN